MYYGFFRGLWIVWKYFNSYLERLGIISGVRCLILWLENE